MSPGPDAVLRTLRSASARDVAEGQAWYATAHDFALGLGKAHAIGTANAAGIIAALSPQQSWGSNQRAAEALCASRDAWGFPANRTKALRILDGEHPLDVLGGNKVRAFYDCILTAADTDAVCIDRHAADIALDRPLDAKPLPSGFLTDRRYALCADAYREAAVYTPYRPAVLQAVTWVARRRAKHPSNPDAFDL